MAAKAEVSEASASMKFKLVSGTDASGNVTYTYKTISGINPEIAADDFLDIAQKIGALQSKEVDTIYRITTDVLVSVEA